MTTRQLALGLIATVVVAGAVVTSTHGVRADAPPSLGQATFARKAAPPALDNAKKLVRINQAIKLTNPNAAKIISASPVDARVTPMSPRGTGGAEIKSAGGLHFYGPTSDEPDGTYLLAAGFVPAVSMKFATEPNKIVVIDCRLHPMSGTSVFMTKTSSGGGSGGGQVTVDDGHAMVAIPTSGTSTELTVAMTNYNTKPGDPVGHFYGCDLMKM